MGGCCYRYFTEHEFGEIWFPDTSESEHVRGYGTRLMAQTKEKKNLWLSFLLTFVINNAVP